MPIIFEKCTHCKYFVSGGETEYYNFWCKLAERENHEKIREKEPWVYYFDTKETWTLAKQSHWEQGLRINEKFIVPDKCPYLLEFTI